MNAVRVKICGITNPGDAAAAIQEGADALGFNLFPGSKRHVLLAEIGSWLPSFLGEALRVAVMVNPSIQEVREAWEFFDVIQLHGQETPGFCAEAGAGRTLWKAFAMSGELDAAMAASFEADALVIDSAVPGAFGGTGRLIDLDCAAAFVKACADRPVWLSGGLSPGNVAAAVGKVRPFGVDAASGVEVPGDPRRKDRTRVRDFIHAAKTA